MAEAQADENQASPENKSAGCRAHPTAVEEPRQPVRGGGSSSPMFGSSTTGSGAYLLCQQLRAIYRVSVADATTLLDPG